MTFTMTGEQVAAVQDFWRSSVLPLGNVAARIFYRELFRRAPTLRAHFGDLANQESLLMTTLNLVVEGLANPTSLVQILGELGSIPAHRRAVSADYAVVGEALLGTLERGFGDAFTPDLRAAWLALYEWMAATMQEEAAAAF